MAVASVDDVATSLGRPISGLEEAQVEMWLDDAERQIRRRLGDLALLDQDDLAYVEREAVILKIKRPDSASTVTVAADDASVTKRYERDTGQISILDEWWTLLSPGDDSAVGFSTRPAFEPDTPPVDSWA